MGPKVACATVAAQFCVWTDGKVLIGGRRVRVRCRSTSLQRPRSPRLLLLLLLLLRLLLLLLLLGLRRIRCFRQLLLLGGYDVDIIRVGIASSLLLALIPTLIAV